MIAVTISIILSVVAIVSIAIAVYEEYKRYKTTLSFREPMLMTSLPVVLFECGDTPLCFLLDTGSDSSYINKSILPALNYKETDEKTFFLGCEGNKQEVNICTLDIHYKKVMFKDESFRVADLDNAFNTIKQASGVTIHGILGSTFFKKYEYVIDFKSLIAYIK